LYAAGFPASRRVNRIVKILLALATALVALTCHAADAIYNETADAKAEISHALAEAAGAGTPVLVIFGANWCGDCKVLDLAMKQGSSAPLFRDFKVVKVDVGRFDRNVDIARSYGVPLKKGIPAVVVLSPQNRVLYVTREGELADARNMGETGIHDFFKRVTPGLKARS